MRMVFEHMAKAGQGANLTVVGHTLPSGGELVVRSSATPQPLLPPAAEERPSGDPTGAVLGFTLAEAILEAQGGTVRERDGALVVTLPKK